MATKRAVSNSFDRTSSRIRIEVDELIEIIEDYTEMSEVNISIVCGEYELNGLEDIRQNKGLVEGFPRIDLGRVTLAFRPKDFNMRDYSSLNDEEIARLETLWRRLTKYRDPLRIVLWVESAFVFLVGSLIVGSLFSGSLRVTIFSTYSEPNYYVGLASFSFLGVLIAAALVKKMNSVFFSPKQNFWKRNFDTIVVGTIMLIVGALVGRLI